MRTIVSLATAAAATLALAACGSSDSASEDAIADTVEMPADEAMTDVPMPVADANDERIANEAAADAAGAVEDDASVDAAGDEAEQAAADAEAAVEAATQAAEETM